MSGDDADVNADDDVDDDDDHHHHHLTVQSWQESACSSFTQWSTKPFPVLNDYVNSNITIMITSAKTLKT